MTYLEWKGKVSVFPRFDNQDIRIRTVCYSRLKTSFALGSLIFIMICNLAVYITDLALADEAVSIINYETFQCLTITRPLHFLYRLKPIRRTNILQSWPSVPTYCCYTYDPMRLSPRRLNLYQQAIINRLPNAMIQYPLPAQHFHYQSHYWTPSWTSCIDFTLKNYFPNIYLKHGFPARGPRWGRRPHL